MKVYHGSSLTVDPNVLESLLKESLEKEIITIIAHTKKIDVREAMDTYYRSKLSDQIDKGTYGIQYLNAQYLADDLVENESELFVQDGNNISSK